MKTPPLPADEEQRLDALSKYELLDMATEKIYDEITSIASIICDVPICLITIVDKNKQWFVSNHGMSGVVQTARDYSFCAHAIHDNKLMEVQDSHKDDRFFDNPFVIGEPYIRFYAGVPLTNPDGYKLGTLCVIDSKPKKLNEQQQQILNMLSNVVTTLFETRKSILKDMNKILSMEEQLRSMANLKNSILKSISEGIITIDQYGRVIFTNDKVNKLFNYSGKEILQVNITNLINKSNIYLQSHPKIQATATKKDRTTFPVEVVTTPLDNGLLLLSLNPVGNAPQPSAH